MTSADVDGRSSPSGRSGFPTMRDVSELAGVGLKTVSRVVNGEHVRPENEARVKDAIAKLGFRRNYSAAMLRKRQSASIGLVLEDISEPFQSVLTRSVEEVTMSRGSVLITASCGNNPEREELVVRALSARRVDGLIVFPAPHSHSYLEREIDAGVATVFVDRPPTDISADTVLADNAGGVRSGIDHLVKQGHRRIAYLGDRRDLFTASERLRGYEEALKAAGLKIDAALVEMSEPDLDRLRVVLTGMRALQRPVTALFTGNSRLTVAAIRILRELHWAPALVGFDDFDLADLLRPAVTVVAQDPASMGRVAADLLFRRLAGDTGPAQDIHMRTRLIVRGSGEVAP